MPRSRPSEQRKGVMEALAAALATVLMGLRPGEDRIEARDAFDAAVDAQIERMEATDVEPSVDAVERYDYETEGLGGT